MEEFEEFKGRCLVGRETIEAAKAQLEALRRDLINGSFAVPAEADDHEMIANVTLAFRHLEDAKMRLGKAIQAFDGGQSCYPR